MAILPIFIPHAGCPHQCVFCNQKAISGQKTAAVEGAKEQIKRWRSWLRPSAENEAAFYGGSFTGLEPALQEQLLSLTDELIAEGMVGRVRLSTRPDYINKEVLALLKAHHVELVELGVQSLDNAVLQRAERGHRAEAVYEAMALLKSCGFKTGIQLMVGMPGQNFASVQTTAKAVAGLRPDIARIYPLLVIKGTPLEMQYAAGQFAPLELAEAVTQSAYVYRTLTAAGIKVIRVGLQADGELCAPGNIVAGPFHPSMGELVQSCLVRQELTPKLRALAEQGAQELVLRCPKRMESKLRGMKNANMDYWQKLFPNIRLTICADVSGDDEIKISGKYFL